MSEDDLLALIFPSLPTNDSVLVGPGDDTAQLATGSGAVLATTDAMVLGRDWRDEWSTGEDVGRKCVAQNVADIAAMGGVTTGLLITLVAAPETNVAWVQSFTKGLVAAAGEIGVAVLGGDLSSAPAGVRMISVTALGETEVPVVHRSGATPGDVIAFAGSLGRSAAGLELLQRGTPDLAPELVAYHCRPRAAYEQGPVAARCGATAMLDLSDGLVRDLGRIAKASGVRAQLDGAALAPFVEALATAVGEEARACVLTGGEEHSLLATFPDRGAVPEGWHVLGTVGEGAGVVLDGELQHGGGWDHFAG
ncbi:thiamine-phosphate kinase [Leekyejoonella antrihumi]|uniref:thiamine-phosphate kinase n=1 Tax=Leekyejoonella antrihumi TaxID=1660198 RepID=UPI001FE6DC66|nr:thiamine-phosphate kinase [Leekyejoonella antrihumi]